VIKVLSTTAGYGISRDQGKRSYGVERSFGATGLLEFSTLTQKEEKGGREKGYPNDLNPKRRKGGGERKDSLI
jgi:hypothetical protein